MILEGLSSDRKVFGEPMYAHVLAAVFSCPLSLLLGVLESWVLGRAAGLSPPPCGLLSQTAIIIIFF